MIISRTPYRISFFGGGTDHPVWYREHGGSVLAATINKYCYLSVRYLPPFFERRLAVVYSRLESCMTVDEIAHPAVREGLRHLNLDRCVEIHHDGDLPARTGIGSSSAFTVGLLSSVAEIIGEPPGEVARKLPLTDDVTSALVDGAGPLGAVLSLVRQYEQADVQGLASGPIPGESFALAYLKALAWVEQSMRVAMPQAA